MKEGREDEARQDTAKLQSGALNATAKLPTCPAMSSRRVPSREGKAVDEGTPRKT